MTTELSRPDILPTLEECLPLARLYARFDALAEGRTHGDSSAAHRAVLDRLAANRRVAEALGWAAFALERQGGSGRIRLRGVRSAGLGREVVPDWIPRSPAEPAPATHRPPNATPDQTRYREIKAVIREQLLVPGPPLTVAAFERLASRMAAAAYKKAALPHTREPTVNAGPNARSPDGESDVRPGVRCPDDSGA